MEINSLINIATGRSAMAYSTSLLKRANDIQAQQVSQLIQAIPQSPSPSPDGVGQNIDIVA